MAMGRSGVVQDDLMATWSETFGLIAVGDGQVAAVLIVAIKLVVTENRTSSTR